MSDDLIRTQIRIPNDIYEKIKILADKNRRSINAQMISMFEFYLDSVDDNGIIREEIAFYGTDNQSFKKELANFIHEMKTKYNIEDK